MLGKDNLKTFQIQYQKIKTISTYEYKENIFKGKS